MPLRKKHTKMADIAKRALVAFDFLGSYDSFTAAASISNELLRRGWEADWRARPERTWPIYYLVELYGG